MTFRAQLNRNAANRASGPSFPFVITHRGREDGHKVKIAARSHTTPQKQASSGRQLRTPRTRSHTQHRILRGSVTYIPRAATRKRARSHRGRCHRHAGLASGAAPPTAPSLCAMSHSWVGESEQAHTATPFDASKPRTVREAGAADQWRRRRRLRSRTQRGGARVRCPPGAQTRRGRGERGSSRLLFPVRHRCSQTRSPPAARIRRHRRLLPVRGVLLPLLPGLARRCTLTLARKRTLVDARAALPPARRAALSFSRARARALTCMRAEVKETAAASEGIRMSGKGTDVKAESPRAHTSCGRRLFQQ